MHVKWVWSCHENLHKSTIFSNPDAGPYLSCICSRSYLHGDSYESCCLKDVNNTIIMLRALGFTIHPEKSVLKPTQNLTYLGFIINSKDMTLNLTEEKQQRNYDICTKLFAKSKPRV